MASFLAQFYSEGKAVPPEILASDEPEGRALLEEWLAEERGGAVRIRVPQRGPGRDLIRIAAENSDAAARRGEAEARSRTQFAVDALAEKLGLDGAPTRIECFDISTIGGTATVASLVVFEEGLPDKSSYRRYKVKTIEGQDDFGAMREVLVRRFLRAEEMPLPDLLIVDGGAGQLASALAALQEAGVVDVPLAGLAKARSGRTGKQAVERVYLPGRREPVLLEPDSPESLLIERIRDEAHRFAITFHRKVRSKLAISSMLDGVEGVGETWRNRLLARFGSVTGIRMATLDELLLVPGLPRETARRIHDFLKAGPGEMPSSAGDATKTTEGDEK
jgi:excinuclease ABC subunit C